MARGLAIEPRRAKRSRARDERAENSWGERDLEQLFTSGVAELGPDDVQGPRDDRRRRPADGGDAGPRRRGRAEGRRSEPRLVVFGDSDFATNQMLGAYSNRDLFVNSVNWLLGDVEAISVRPPKSRASRLSSSSEQFSQIRALSLFVLPRADRGGRRAGPGGAAAGRPAVSFPP